MDQPRCRITTPGITAAACIPPFAAGPIKKMIEAEAASEITDHDIRVDLAEPVQEIKQPDQSHADLDGAVRHQQEQATDQREPDHGALVPAPSGLVVQDTTGQVCGAIDGL